MITQSVEVSVVVVVAVLCTTGLLANTALILAYIRRPTMRTSTNVYFVHKAVSDLISLLTFPVHLLEVVNERGWSLGNWPCKVVVSLETLCMVASANILFGAVYDRLTAVRNPGDGQERTVSKARGHVAAAWVCSLLMVIPVLAVGWTVSLSPGRPSDDPAYDRLICGYGWPPGDKYHTIYFGALLAVELVGHYIIYASFVYITWKEVRKSKEAFLARHDTVQRCRAVACVLVFNFVAYFVFWARQVYIMVVTGGDQSHIPHIPGDLTDPFSLAASLAYYCAAGSNLFLYGVSMDQWRSVAFDALRCRCCCAGGRREVHPFNEEHAVAVIDVTAAPVDEPAQNHHVNGHSDTDNDSRVTPSPAGQFHDDDMYVQEIDIG